MAKLMNGLCKGIINFDLKTKLYYLTPKSLRISKSALKFALYGIKPYMTENITV